METVLIVDDHLLIHTGMEKLLTGLIKNVALYFSETYPEALQELKTRKFSLILLDLGIPGGIGADMIDGLRKIQPGVKILICSGRDEILNAHYCVGHGANGYLHKNSNPGEFEAAIRTVMEGKTYLSSKAQQGILNSVLGRAEPKSINPLDTLTAGEKEILDLILAGKIPKEIASELRIQLSTVSTKKARVFQKLKVDNIIDLFKKVSVYTNGSSF